MSSTTALSAMFLSYVIPLYWVALFAAVSQLWLGVVMESVRMFTKVPYIRHELLDRMFGSGGPLLDGSLATWELKRWCAWARG